MAIRASLVRRCFVQHASHTKTPGQSCLVRRSDRETGERIWLGRKPARCISFPLGSARAKDKKKGEGRKEKKETQNGGPRGYSQSVHFSTCVVLTVHWALFPSLYSCTPSESNPIDPIRVSKIIAIKIEPRKGNRLKKLYRKLMAQKKQVPHCTRDP